MKKTLFILFLVLLLSALSVFSACSRASGYDPFDPPDFIPTAVPSDWARIESDNSRHTAVTPVAMDKIPATHVAFSKTQSADLVKPLSDGGCLAVWQVLVDENDTSGSGMYYLKAARFKSNGIVLWEKQYNSNPYQGYINTMCVFPDGGFAVSLQVTLNDSTLYSSTDRLYRFSSEGGLLWMTKDEPAEHGALQYLFATQDGSVITAGTTAVTKPDGGFDNNDITLMRFEKSGTRSKIITIGTVSNDSLRNASFSSGTGLVLSWATQLENSAVESGVAYSQVSKMDCYDADLNRQWTLSIPLDENFFDVIALSSGEGVLAFASRVVSQEDTSVTSSQSLLVYFDSSGTRCWTYRTEEEKTWMMAAARLDDGRFVGGWFRNTGEGLEESSLVILSETGSVRQTLGPVPGILQHIIATKDGGFTIILRQTVSALPQPPYISSIWTDTEAVIAHYDKDQKLVWQRSVDQYKHELRIDAIIPTADDRLLIG